MEPIEPFEYAKPGVQSANTDRITQQQLLLREMQQRMAHSLQIVAGILLLNARAAKSGESRQALLDAYSRIMAVAAVQQQLLETGQPSTIRLDRYLAQLSKSVTEILAENIVLSVAVQGGASMESDKVEAIGLIVTELVINALKHAFPGNRDGKIDVSYKASGSDWTLLVSDNGVGHSNASRTSVRSGYGTKIIGWLIQQLDAHVSVDSGSKGTRVSVIHSVNRLAEHYSGGVSYNRSDERIS